MKLWIKISTKHFSACRTNEILLKGKKTNAKSLNNSDADIPTTLSETFGENVKIFVDIS